MLIIPPDTTIRLSQERGAWIVSLNRPGTLEGLKQLTRPVMSAMLTHDEGATWTDRLGEQIATAMLAEEQTAVFMVFETMADALACKKRADALLSTPHAS